MGNTGNFAGVIGPDTWQALGLSIASSMQNQVESNKNIILAKWYNKYNSQLAASSATVRRIESQQRKNNDNYAFLKGLVDQGVYTYNGSYIFGATYINAYRDLCEANYMLSHTDMALNYIEDMLVMGRNPTTSEITEYVASANNPYANLISDFATGMLGAGMFTEGVVNEKVSTDIEPNPLENVCFTEGTLISTKNGYEEIRNIEVGDEVYSENPETGEKGLKKVVNVYRNETKELIHIFVGNEEIEATPTHPFWVAGKGRVAARDLQTKDKVKLYNENVASVEKTVVEKLDTATNVYNIEVEDWHTYFVSRHEVLVHNACNGTPGNNQAQNKQVRDISNKLDLSKDQQRKLHEEISGRNYSFQEILQTAKDMFKKN